MPEPTYTSQGATFSEPDRVYRYLLWREWDPARPRVLFVMLNPSTADETVLDPTLRRCLGFAQRWGFGSFTIANLFALRSTDPKRLREVEDPVGPLNDGYLSAAAMTAGRVVAAWGAHGGLYHRADAVTRMLRPCVDLMALRLTSAGDPGHPLYLPAALEPFVWQARRAA